MNDPDTDPQMSILGLLGGLLSLALAWLLLRNVDLRDPNAWDGLALERTHALVEADGAAMAGPIADLWQLEVERGRAMRAEGDGGE